MQRLTRNAPAVLLALAMAVAAATVLVLTSKATFFADTWDVLINRRDPSLHTLLSPHNEHLIAIPVLFEQLILRVFGMSSARPEYVLLVAFLLITAGLLYVYVKRRVGPWFALFAAVALLFLGPAWEVLAWPFEITFCGPVMLGLAALLALEREDRLGDVAACAFLVLGLGFSGLGVPFVVAAAVVVLQGPRQSRRRRAFVFVVPALLFAAWYVGWGHDAESHVSLRNVLASPRYVADSIASSLGSLVGLGTSPETGVGDPAWGRALLIALVIGLGYRQYRLRPRISPGLWPVAAAAAANWILSAFNNIAGRDPTVSRYQYVGAVLILLILANLLRDVKVTRRMVLAGAAVTLLAVGPNLVVLKNGTDLLRKEAVLTRADTAAFEIARRTVDPDLQLNPEIAGTGALVNVYAGAYLEAVDEYGSPAYSVAELEAAPEEGRRQADIVLAHALPLNATTTLGGLGASTGPGCTTIPPGGGDPEGIPLAPGSYRIAIDPGPEASIDLRRFAVGEFPVANQGVAGGSVTELRIPPDSARLPWRLRVEARQSARLCR
jgi:hypothetical protein